MTIVYSHRRAAVHACVITDELTEPASGCDEPGCHMTGSPLPDPEGFDRSPPPARMSNSQPSTPPPETVEFQGDHVMVSKNLQIPTDAPDQEVEMRCGLLARFPPLAG